MKKNKKFNEIFKTKNHIDMVLLIILLLLFAVGLICLYSASFENARSEGRTSYHYAMRQLIFGIVGIAVMLFVAYFVPYDVFKRPIVPYGLVAVSVVLLTIVLFIKLPAGEDIRRWIYIGPIQFQPSEIAKFAIILFSAYIASRHSREMKTIKYGLLPCTAVMAVIALLMFKEPHLSGTALVVLLAVSLMIIGGTSWKNIAILMLLGAAAVAFAFVFGLIKPYQLERIEVWFDPENEKYIRDEGWQTVQSLYAIGSGGLFGVGLGNSRGKYYVPECQNDFIFSIICEEVGLVGAVFIIFLFILLILRGFTIGIRARDKFGHMLAVGVMMQIAIQVLLNIGVVTNSLPNTGISLPFFSYGGTSLLMLFFEMGVVLSVSRTSNVRKVSY